MQTILQRQHRLVKQQQHTGGGKEERGYDKLPEYNSVALEEKITMLRGEYWKHQDSLNIRKTVKPIDSPPVKEQMVLRNRRD